MNTILVDNELILNHTIYLIHSFADGKHIHNHLYEENISYSSPWRLSISGLSGIIIIFTKCGETTTVIESSSGGKLGARY